MVIYVIVWAFVQENGAYFLQILQTLFSESDLSKNAKNICSAHKKRGFLKYDKNNSERIFRCRQRNGYLI